MMRKHAAGAPRSRLHAVRKRCVSVVRGKRESAWPITLCVARPACSLGHRS